MQNRNRFTDLEKELIADGGAGGWGGHSERKRQLGSLGSTRTPLLHLKWITNKDLLHSTGNSAQRYVAAWKGREFGRELIPVYIWLRCFAVHLKLSGLLSWLRL